MSTSELLTWHPVAERLPDSDITVLCWLEPGGKWYSGWLDGQTWYDAATGAEMDGVTAWAEPCGPGARTC